MIYFDLSSKRDVIDEHFTSLEKELKNRTNSSSLTKNTKNFIIRNLRKILTGTPDEIFQLNEDFGKIKHKMKSIKTELNQIFNYKDFVLKNETKYKAYNLAKNLNIRVCLYCNREYTLTIIKDKKYITRPEFDHFFDKATYPLLALSIYNLIPSCHICNSTLKGTRKFSINTHLHPYIDDCLPHYKYTFVPFDIDSIFGNHTNLEIKIVTSSNLISSKIELSSKVFELETIYNGHVEELKDLFDIRYKFSESYLEQLFDTYKSLGISYEEAYRVAFGVHYNESEFTRRPLSKIKKDLLQELKVVR
jgi:hypothetical protein